MNFNFNNPWDQLLEACVGSVYPEKFFSAVVDTTVRNHLERILIETIEDLDHIASTLTKLGVTVHRPIIPENLSITDFTDVNDQITLKTANSNSLIPRPPLQVRDSFFVCGDTLYQTRHDGPYIQNLLESLGGKQVDLTDDQFDAPLVTVFGNQLFVDTLEMPNLQTTVTRAFPGKQITAVSTGGHNDAVFGVIKPGVLITLEDPALYQTTFPGWDILSVPTQSWRALKDFRSLKKQNGGRWWSPNAVSNPEFVKFVDTWCNQWVGFAAETVFDVNCLVVNKNLVLINNHNDQVESFLKRHGTDTIVVPFRHRFFWDGGIHCVTNDLVRQS
jgi:hypothetical protein